MHHQIRTSESSARPPVGGDGFVCVDFMRKIPDWTIRARPDHLACDIPVEPPGKAYGVSPTVKAKSAPAEQPKSAQGAEPRPRCPGSKPVKPSTDKFEAGRDAIANRRLDRNKLRAELQGDRETEMTGAAKADDMTLCERRDKHVDAAKDVTICMESTFRDDYMTARLPDYKVEFEDHSAAPPVAFDWDMERGGAEPRDVADHQLSRPDGRGNSRASGPNGAYPEVVLGDVLMSQPDATLLCRIADLRHESGEDADTDLIVKSANFAAVRFEPCGSVQ